MENKRDFERNDTGRDVLTLQQKEAYLKADERLDELHRNAYPEPGKILFWNGCRSAFRICKSKSR